jgi:hypothetical protein
MGEVAIPSQTSTPIACVPSDITIQKYRGRVTIEFFENSVEMKFEGDVKGRMLDTAIRLIPRKYKMWRNSQLTELKKKEK